MSQDYRDGDHLIIRTNHTLDREQVDKAKALLEERLPGIVVTLLGGFGDGFHVVHRETDGEKIAWGLDADAVRKLVREEIAADRKRSNRVSLDELRDLGFKVDESLLKPLDQQQHRQSSDLERSGILLDQSREQVPDFAGRDELLRQVDRANLAQSAGVDETHETSPSSDGCDKPSVGEAPAPAVEPSSAPAGAARVHGVATTFSGIRFELEFLQFSDLGVVRVLAAGRVVQESVCPALGSGDAA